MDDGVVATGSAGLTEPASAFETFVVDLSADLAAARLAETDPAINEGLRRLASYLDLERAVLARRVDGRLEIEHYWISDGLTPRQSEFPRVLDAADYWVAGQCLAGRTMVFHGWQDYPEQAVIEREYVEKTGIATTVWVPGVQEGEVVGVLVMDAFSRPREWAPEIVERLKVPVELLFSTLARHETLGKLQRQAAFEELIADTTASFVEREDVDAAIGKALDLLGESLEADLVTITQYAAERDSYLVTHEWRPGAGLGERQFSGLVVKEELPWLERRLRTGRPLLVRTLDDFPPEAARERALAEQMGLESVIWLPFERRANTGYVVFNWRGREISWSDSRLERIQLVVEVLGSALRRREAERTLERRLLFEELLAKLSQRLVVVRGEKLEAEIERWLEPIAGAIGVEHVVVGALAAPNLPASVRVLTWNAGRRVRPLTPEEAPWLVGAIFERGESLSIGSLADLPPEAEVDRKTFEEVGIRAFLSVPLRCGDDVYGGMSLCSLSREREWSEYLRAWLGLVGELLANALARRHAEQELRRALDQSRLDQDSLRQALDENERLKKRLEADNLYLREEISKRLFPGEIVGNSPALTRVLEQAQQVAETDSTVLILGETGTGKELLAQFIHRHSGRRDRPLVKVNCGALPATLVEAELFGREKGAYTGALSRQSGRFEIADGSTIFLDEIGDLPLELQVKLLRVLQDGEMERLGSSKTLTVDVRVIAATNRELEKAVRDGRFREDLYYRLNVFPITVPPLRDRPEDIPDLVWAFVRELMESMGRSIESVPRKTLEGLCRHPWPGNVRELRNVVERAMITNRGPELRIELPEARHLAIAAGPASTLLNDVQRRHILEILERTRWRLRGKQGAAELLGVKPSTLEYRMKKLGIERPR